MKNKNGILSNSSQNISLKVSIKIIKLFLNSILAIEKPAKSTWLKQDNSFNLGSKKHLFYATFHKKIKDKVLEKLNL